MKIMALLTSHCNERKKEREGREREGGSERRIGGCNSKIHSQLVFRMEPIQCNNSNPRFGVTSKLVKSIFV